jgi:hypothetical protein
MAGASWSRVANSTISKYVRKRENNTLRNRKLTALMKKRGRITFNWSGDKMDWKIKFKRQKMRTFQDGDTLDFPQSDRYRTAKLDWRGYASTDSMTKAQFLQNRSTEAIVNLYAELAKDLMDDMDDEFGEEMYVNGYDPDNIGRIHGIESFMQASVNAGNGAASPTGSFAGLSCVPGDFGGSWTGGPTFAASANGGWPNGRGDAEFDFWSPLIVDYGDTLFDPTHQTWENNCIEAISFAIIKGKKSKSLTGGLNLFLLEDELYRKYLKQIRGKERLVVQRSQEASDMVSLGFLDTVNQDGTDITSEYGITPGGGYGFNVEAMELRSQQAQLFVPEGPDQDISSQAWRFSIDFYGNMVWNPKFQVKLANLTNPDDSDPT